MISERALTRMVRASIASLLIAGCSSGGGTTWLRGIDGTDVPVRNDITVAPLAGLNSRADDLGVTMPLDSTVLIFSSARSEASGRHSIFYSRLTAEGWSRPKLSVELNNEQSNGMPTVSADGNVLHFTGCDYGLGDCDLYRVNVGPRGDVPIESIPWSIPTNLGLPVNGLFWESQSALSADGGLLYFASDRPGGLGGKDIWISRRNPDGSWDTPFNAGEKINTTFDEITPWPTPDGQTLLFSSNGHPGMGGFDVFSATITPGGTVVENLGRPINSVSDELAFSLSSDGTRAFVASNRSGGAGGYDLYRIDPVPVQIDPLMIVRGAITTGGRRILATIEITDLTTGQKLGAFPANQEDGSYAVVLPRGFNYALTAQADGYLFSSRQVNVPYALERNAEQRIDFQLQPITGTIRLLVFFDENEINLKRESSADLDRLVRFMTADPGIIIEVAGHTDNSGDEQANRSLSEQRAQAVKSYLVGNRIPAERIIIKGYGSSQPIAPNDTEESRGLNRRVEVRVVSSGKGG
jgi:outer membrane protein OmpA-like peptidoglycan-associated protein